MVRQGNAWDFRLDFSVGKGKHARYEWYLSLAHPLSHDSRSQAWMLNLIARGGDYAVYETTLS